MVFALEVSLYKFFRSPKKIYSDVDITLDLKKVYDQLKLNEAYVTNEQKDLLNFLKSNEKIFI